MPSLVRAHREIFEPVLYESSAVEISLEQKEYIKAILDVSCSDSRFAQKAYLAIGKVLSLSNTVPPVVESLSPNTVELGSPSFDLHVLGSGFNETSVIIFAGQEEPTTFVSATELTTGVDMSFWSGPDTVDVAVATQGVMSESLDFVFTEPVEGTRKVAKGKVIEERRDTPIENIVEKKKS